MVGKTSWVRVVALEGGVATLYTRYPGCQSGLSDSWIFVLVPFCQRLDQETLYDFYRRLLWAYIRGGGGRLRDGGRLTG